MQHEKRPYEAPALKALGKIADLTQVGTTQPGEDVRQGSVYPPGHYN